jgi:hypothetical protein
MDEHLRNFGFHCNEYANTLYYRMQGQTLVIVVLYVDDLIITGSYEAHIKKVKQELKKGFKMTDLGPLRYYVGVEVSQQCHQILLKQTKYVTYLLKKFGMENCRLSLTPMEKNLKLFKFEGGELVNSTNYRQMIGSLIYLTNTHQIFSYPFIVLSRFMKEPR